MRNLIALALLSISPAANGTQQSPETISVDGEQKFTYSTPLDSAQTTDAALWKRLRSLLPAQSCSALWRGYVGTWEIRQNDLHLVSLKVSDCHVTKPIQLSALKPGATESIKAVWFSGELIFERGPYVPGPCGFSPVCPSGHDVLVFRNGSRVSSEYKEFKR